MAFLGIEIGGTKIAGAAFDSGGREMAQITQALPATYESFLETLRALVAALEAKTGAARSVGICAPYADSQICANIPFMVGRSVAPDVAALLSRPVSFANDANCAALAEALEGAGKGYRSVFGLIMGTGVGGGFILEGHIIAGANGLCGEIGHLPLPYYEESDGARVSCACGQTGCIEKLTAGAALSRLHESLTGKAATPREISENATRGDREARRVLDRYYTVLAKAMTTILHSFDPDIITVSGGLNALPDLYEEIPKRWGAYALTKNQKTKFVAASFGSMAGLRGAAILGARGAYS